MTVCYIGFISQSVFNDVGNHDDFLKLIEAKKVPGFVFEEHWEFNSPDFDEDLIDILYHIDGMAIQASTEELSEYLSGNEEINLSYIANQRPLLNTYVFYL